MPSLKKIFEEIEHLALIISIPQLISAPISVILINLLTPNSLPKDVIEVLDFLIISFPLTIAVGVITVLIRNDQTNFLYCILVVIVAAVLSNLLHSILSSAFPAVDLESAYHEAFESDQVYTHHGSGPLLSFAFKILSLYWKKFGVIMFLQSTAIGIYAGTKYFKKKNQMPY